MFRKISASNFFSWELLEFDFQSGVTLITGDNLDDGTSEGAGKSSIANALCWALYGELPKDTNIDDVIRTGQKSCMVTVQLNNGSMITRSRKPNQLFISDWEVTSVEQGKDVKETQKMIESLIGMSFDTFCQSVYFAQNYTNKFITATQENKAKILSELQDLSVFDKASRQSHEKAKQAKNDHLQVEIEKGYTYNSLVNADRELKTFEQLSQTFDQDRMTQLDEIIGRSYSVSVKINQLEADIKSIVNLSNIDDKMDELEEISKDLRECHNKLYHINALKTVAANETNCPMCGQDLPGAEKIIIPDDTEFKLKHAYLTEEHTRISLELAHLMNEKNRNSLLQEKLQNLIEQKNQITKEIDRVEKLENPYINKIEEISILRTKLRTKIDNLNDKMNDINKLASRYDYLKDGFKEIKSYVFQSLLSELNRNTNRYLNDLFEVPASIIFDNISDEGDVSKIKTTVMLDGYERSLGLLSGGQFRRVQLAVDFALSDIVAQRSKNPINVRILDESFKDLSEVSMERIVNVLQKMSGSTILIEHNSIIKNIVNRVYKVELKDGVSVHIP
jgi:DNA repair exonuclease SbcCD ATPase subunit